MVYLLSFFTVLFALFAGMNANAARSLSFRDALEYGLRHSPDLNSADRERVVAELERKNALAKFFPTIDLSTSHGAKKSSPASKSSALYGDVSANLKETLYDNGANFTGYKIASFKNQIAELNFQQKRAQLLLDIARLYFNYVKAKELYAIQTEQLDLMKKQYVLLSKDYRQGLKLKKDYLRFKTQVGRAEIDELDARTEVEKAENDLIRIIGVPAGEWAAFSIKKSTNIILEKDLPEDRSYPPLNLNKHYVSRLMELQREVDERNVELVSRKKWPQLYLKSGVTYSSTDYLAPGATFKGNDRWDWNALFTIEYNFLDWGTRSRDLAIARENQQVSDNKLQMELLAAKRDIEQMMLNLEKLKKNFHNARELKDLEEANARSLERDYRQGQVGYLDLTSAYRDLASAKRTYLAARFDLKLAALEYRYHEGTLYESIF